MATSPMTNADKAYIRAAYERGDTHRAIAEHLGRPKSTVGRYMATNGMRYDSTNQQAAITKMVLSGQERISALRLEVIGIAEHEAAEIRAVQRGDKKWKTVLKAVGGSEQVEELDFIPPNDKRANANSLGSHAATIARLAPKEDGDKAAEVDSVMDKLITGLQKAYEGPATEAE